MTKTRLIRTALVPLGIVALCGVAVAPLLRGASPCTHDGGFHYFSVAAVRLAVREGTLFSRWLPDLAFGYGIPFLNYRAPVSYYLSMGLHLMGLPLPWALNLVYVLSILGSAVGMYLLGRDLFGWRAGSVAAVAYAYAPYQLLDAIVRGNAPESVALALMPFILWAFRRLALRGGRRWSVTAVGLLAALYLTHNISSLLFTPMLIAYLVVLWWIYRERGAWGQVVLALLLALGLTSFFWLPALLERGYVQLYLSSATRNNQFHYNFLSLAKILDPPDPVDTSLMNPPLAVNLGLVPAVLAGLGLTLGLVETAREGTGRPRSGMRAQGLLAVRDQLKESRLSVLFFGVCGAIFVFMSTPASLFVWELVPLLRFVQFPWRFVGRASLPVALLGGATLRFLDKPPTGNPHEDSGLRVTVSHLLPSVFIGLLIIGALPSTYPPTGYCPMEPQPGVREIHRYERDSGLVGVEPVGAYFPIWVQRRPTESPLESQYSNEGVVARFDESALPGGGQIVEAEYTVNQARIVVRSPEPFRARYLSFYFPGWRAWIDGERVEIAPSDPEGLITFDVPRGQHTIRVGFGETRLRLAADGMSVLSLIALLVVALRLPRAASDGRSHSASPSPQSAVLIGVIGVSLLAFKLGVVDRVSTPFRRPTLLSDGSLPHVAYSLERAFVDGLRLIGYDQDARRVPGDGKLRVDLYWTVSRQPSRRYQTVVHLVGPDGFRWSPKHSFRPTDYQDAPPTTDWTAGQYALDSHEVEPLPGTPPGVYEVVLTVFDRETLAPVSVLNEQGQPAAPELALGKVTVTASRSALGMERLDRHDELQARLDRLTLLGADFSHEEAAAGDPVALTVFWQSDADLIQDVVLELSLVAPDGSTAATYALPPTTTWHPTSMWEPDRIWRGQHVIHLPRDLDSGEYTWWFSVSGSTSGLEHPSPIRVNAPQRTYGAPAVGRVIAAPLGDVATLVGATQDSVPSTVAPGTSLTVTLVWCSEAPTDISYRVFVHLVGPDGELVAQADGVPGQWIRPTTGWLPGEYVEDPHHLTIPQDALAGDYDLHVGLYEPSHGSGLPGGRLTTPDGSDTVSLGTVTVIPED